MKLSRPAAVFAAVIAISGAAAVAVDAATETSPVTLCSNSKTGAVSMPSSADTCTKGTTAFEVASASDVQAIAAQLGSARSDVQALTTRIEALQSEVEALKPASLTVRTYADPDHAGSQFHVEAVGTKLKPGSKVLWHWTYFDESWWSDYSEAVVADDGTVTATFGLMCETSNAYATAETADGETVTSDVIATGAGCS